MGKVILAMSASVDGFLAGPKGELDWAFRSFSDDMGKYITEGLQQTDVILLGRVNYEMMAASWPGQSNPIADLMNSLPKVVFSSTLTEVEWNNSRLAKGSPAEEIAQLRQQHDREIKVLGGAGFARSLSAQGLIDEYQIVSCPTAIGEGMPLFGEAMNLRHERVTRFDSGAVLNVYTPE